MSAELNELKLLLETYSQKAGPTNHELLLASSERVLGLKASIS